MEFFFVEVLSNDSPAAKRPRSSEESQTSPEIEGKIEPKNIRCILKLIHMWTYVAFINFEQ